MRPVLFIQVRSGVILAAVLGLACALINAADKQEPGSIIQILDQEAFPGLIRSISKKKPAHRLPTTYISGDAHDRTAAPYLLQAYKEAKDEGIRCKLIESIGALQDPSLFDWLVERLDDPSIKIQCFAIWALGELQSADSVAPLLQKLWSPNRYIRMTAIDALGKTGKSAYVATELMTFLQDEDTQMRFIAAQALDTTAGLDAAPELMQDLLHEPSLDVQEALTLTLAHTGESVAVSRFIELVKVPVSRTMDHWAMIGLQTAGPSIVVPELTPLMDGDHFQWKISAAQILSQMNVTPEDLTRSGWVGEVKRWAKGSDLIVRQGASALLVKIEAAQASIERTPQP